VTPFLVNFSVCQRDIKVGLYYYAWYDEGYGNRHWNSTPPGSNLLQWNVVDKPILGYYGCQNTTIITQQLQWFTELGVDFLIISWWGPNSYEDESTKRIFSTIQQANYSIQVAIMVEAFDWTNNYNFTAIYEYIYNTYASPYPITYMSIEDKPLVCFYNDANMTGTEARRTDIYFSDPRFAARIVGHNDYVDWWFGVPSSTNSSRAVLPSNKDRVACVEPRYDNYFINGTPTVRFDINYTEGLYDEQWNTALELVNLNKIDYITIYSWNEYHERSQIEPHITDGNYVLSLFGKTESYIDQVKSQQQSAFNPLTYIAVGIVIGLILAWLYLRYTKRESYIREKITPKRLPPEKEREESQRREDLADESTSDSNGEP
jgi:hypothetical protein